MTKLELFNLALSKIPHDRRITALDEDSTEAIRCRDAWMSVRVKCLCAHDWGWATVSRGCHTGCPDFMHGISFTYQRPAGALKIVGLFDRHGRRLKADAHGNIFSCQSPVADIRYIPDDDSVEDWPQWFLDAAAWSLAAELSPIIKGRPDGKLDARAQTELSAAIKIDSSETAWSGTDGRTFAHARR